ncbi:tip elongation aberrant protein 1-like isoform X2 [Trichogramma pretiosum]|uniref:Tip elongation aberrant protein 1 n=1 Tax=Trichogramma kaykai TaxID=54128 RepID=A0ABD2WEY7_9HYME|nr:tip elongation aberrant protein 1-like isoform X2 [Trichogramma pretiosum]
MWSSVTAAGVENGPAPPSRSKHSATLLAGNVYLLGGRNGNLPLKDLWRYSLAESRWEELRPTGEKPPALQEHSTVAYKDCLYVFGGELGFSAGTETPLWCYSIKTNSWRKIRGQKGCAVPRGRRGHTALVHRGQMLIYGGYQDLRGSSSELWAFHFETESWHLLSSADVGPPARHKHSAVLHGDFMYIYGGMTDLQERSDCWRWDAKAASWCLLRAKTGPGPLHGHAACRLPSCMLIFGGESGGSATNELWRFHFGTETWERLTFPGPKPQPRAESVALTISELLINNNGISSSNSISNFATSNGYCRPRTRNNQRNGSCRSFAYGRSSSPDQAPPQRPSFLREISKLSQINLSRLSHPNKCSYSVLSGQDDRELDSPFEVDMEVIEPATGMVKSRSYNALAMQARRRHHQGRLSDQQARNSMFEPLLGNMETNFGGMTREPISVPNFRALALPTPVLTPIEAARLVFVDPDEDTDDDDNEDAKKNASSNRLIEVPEEDRSDFASLHQSHQPPRGESYSSNLCDAAQTPKTPCTRLPHSTSVRFADLEEGEESTSDYASIGARSPGDPLAEDDWPKRNSKSFRNSQNFKDNQLSFSNPNYLGLENTSELSDQDVRYAKMLNSPPDSVLEDEPGRSTSQTFSDLLEMQELGTSTRPRAPPKSLPLGSPSRRAVSASRAERQRAKLAASERNERNSPSPAPLYVFLIGGKEKGQVTVFARPVSLWKLQLAPHIF